MGNILIFVPLANPYINYIAIKCQVNSTYADQSHVKILEYYVMISTSLYMFII